MCRLICAFVVRIWDKQVFLWLGSVYFDRWDNCLPITVIEGLSLPSFENMDNVSNFAKGLLGFGSFGVPSTLVHIPIWLFQPMILSRIQQWSCKVGKFKIHAQGLLKIYWFVLESPLPLYTSWSLWGARWLSGRVSDSGARGRGFETYRRHVVSLSKTLYSPKVLVNYPGSGGSVPTWLKNCWMGR